MNMVPRSRDGLSPEFCISFAPLRIEGAGKVRVRAAPAVSCAMGNKEMRTRANRFGGNTPAFPAQWFDGLCRALPGDRLFDTIAPRQRELLENLTPALGASGPHGFTGAAPAVRPHAFAHGDGANAHRSLLQRS